MVFNALRKTSPITVMATLLAVAALAWLARCEGRELFGNYAECRDVLCGGSGKNCPQCKSGEWKHAADGGRGRKNRTKKMRNDGGNDEEDDGGDNDDGGGNDGGNGDDDGGGWNTGARITCFSDTRFAGTNVDTSRLAAVHEKDWDAYKDKTIEIRWPGKDGKDVIRRAQIKDYCNKNHASCQTNLAESDRNFLIDVHVNTKPPDSKVQGEGSARGDACWSKGSWRIV